MLVGNPLEGFVLVGGVDPSTHRWEPIQQQATAHAHLPTHAHPSPWGLDPTTDLELIGMCICIRYIMLYVDSHEFILSVTHARPFLVNDMFNIVCMSVYCMFAITMHEYTLS